MTSLVSDSKICQEIAPKTEVRALSNPLKERRGSKDDEFTV